MFGLDDLKTRFNIPFFRPPSPFSKAAPPPPRECEQQDMTDEKENVKPPSQEPSSATPGKSAASCALSLDTVCTSFPSFAPPGAHNDGDGDLDTRAAGEAPEHESHAAAAAVLPCADASEPATSQCQTRSSSTHSPKPRHALLKMSLSSSSSSRSKSSKSPAVPKNPKIRNKTLERVKFGDFGSKSRRRTRSMGERPVSPLVPDVEGVRKRATSASGRRGMERRPVSAPASISSFCPQAAPPCTLSSLLGFTSSEETNPEMQDADAEVLQAKLESDDDDEDVDEFEFDSPSRRGGRSSPIPSSLEASPFSSGQGIPCDVDANTRDDDDDDEEDQIAWENEEPLYIRPPEPCSPAPPPPHHQLVPQLQRQPLSLPTVTVVTRPLLRRPPSPPRQQQQVFAPVSPYLRFQASVYHTIMYVPVAPPPEMSDPENYQPRTAANARRAALRTQDRSLLVRMYFLFLTNGMQERVEGLETLERFGPSPPVVVLEKNVDGELEEGEITEDEERKMDVDVPEKQQDHPRPPRSTPPSPCAEQYHHHLAPPAIPLVGPPFPSASHAIACMLLRNRSHSGQSSNAARSREYRMRKRDEIMRQLRREEIERDIIHGSGGGGLGGYNGSGGIIVFPCDTDIEPDQLDADEWGFIQNSRRDESADTSSWCMPALVRKEQRRRREVCARLRRKWGGRREGYVSSQLGKTSTTRLDVITERALADFRARRRSESLGFVEPQQQQQHNESDGDGGFAVHGAWIGGVRPRGSGSAHRHVPRRSAPSVMQSSGGHDNDDNNSAAKSESSTTSASARPLPPPPRRVHSTPPGLVMSSSSPQVPSRTTVVSPNVLSALGPLFGASNTLLPAESGEEWAKEYQRMDGVKLGTGHTLDTNEAPATDDAPATKASLSVAEKEKEKHKGNTNTANNNNNSNSNKENNDAEREARRAARREVRRQRRREEIERDKEACRRDLEQMRELRRSRKGSRKEQQYQQASGASTAAAEVKPDEGAATTMTTEAGIQRDDVLAAEEAGANGDDEDDEEWNRLRDGLVKSGESDAMQIVVEESELELEAPMSYRIIAPASESTLEPTPALSPSPSIDIPRSRMVPDSDRDTPLPVVVAAALSMMNRAKRRRVSSTPLGFRRTASSDSSLSSSPSLSTKALSARAPLTNVSNNAAAATAVLLDFDVEVEVGVEVDMYEVEAGKKAGGGGGGVKRSRSYSGSLTARVSASASSCDHHPCMPLPNVVCC